jgi:hypothetical protein
MLHCVVELVVQSAATCGRRFPVEAFSTLKMEVMRSSETSVKASSTQRHTPEDDILHSHRCENLKSYIFSVFKQDVQFQ